MEGSSRSDVFYKEVKESMSNMIYFVEIEEDEYLYEENEYFYGVTECGRYVITTPYLSEARVFDDKSEAKKIADYWCGKVIEYIT